jgi:hypothetical protein
MRNVCVAGRFDAMDAGREIKNAPSCFDGAWGLHPCEGHRGIVVSVSVVRRRMGVLGISTMER